MAASRGHARGMTFWLRGTRGCISCTLHLLDVHGAHLTHIPICGIISSFDQLKEKLMDVQHQKNEYEKPGARLVPLEPEERIMVCGKDNPNVFNCRKTPNLS